MTRRRALSLLIPCVLAGALMGPTASVSSAHASDKLQYWYGTVTKVLDGDTILVLVDGTKTPVPIRNTAIQAMEVAHGDEGLSFNECHSLEATARMADLVGLETPGDTKGARVRLSAYHSTSQSLGRALRFVDVWVHGKWLDIQVKLLTEGHVLWKSDLREPAHNGSYHVAAEVAMRAGIGIYDTDYCKSGPSQNVPIDMSIQWNGHTATSGTNTVNGEYVQLKNLSNEALPIAGWVIRDATHNLVYRFPSGASIPALGLIRLRAGTGTATASTFYWGLTSNPFVNPIYGLAYPGDGAYLVDRDGDFRAWFVYPCASSCTDPLKGKVVITEIQADAPGADSDNPNGEYVVIAARSSNTSAIDVSGYVIDNPPYNKVIPQGTLLAPGERLRLEMGEGSSLLSSTPKTLHLGAASGVLNNTGDVVILRTFSNIYLDCEDWGDNHDC